MLSFRNNILLIFLLLIAFSCDYLNTSVKTSDTEMYEAEHINQVELPDTLLVMTWNIRFGGARARFFSDCHGDKILMQKKEVEKNMSKLAEAIRQINPDILFLQEIDIQSKRSNYTDEMAYLLDSTELNYGVYATEWKADYIPINGLSRMNSGNAVLSKWELSDLERVALAEVTGLDATDAYFHYKRNLLKTSIKIGATEKLWLFSTQVEEYNHDNTKATQLAEIAGELQIATPFIMGATLNCLPPATEQLSGFEDVACEPHNSDFSAQSQYLQSFYSAYRFSIQLSDYQLINSKYFTFSSDKKYDWNRKLDYLFTSQNFVPASGLTIRSSADGFDAPNLSDHAAVVAKYPLK